MRPHRGADATVRGLILREVEQGIAVRWGSSRVASVDHDHAGGLTVRLQGEQSRTGENSNYKDRRYLREIIVPLDRRRLRDRCRLPKLRRQRPAATTCYRRLPPPDSTRSVGR